VHHFSIFSRTIRLYLKCCSNPAFHIDQQDRDILSRQSFATAINCKRRQRRRYSMGSVGKFEDEEID